MSVIKRAFGRLVFIALAVVAVSYVWTHRPGSSTGCAVAGAAVAHADTTDCPLYVTQAATDSAWANQQQAMRGARVTTDRYITNQSSTPRSITSGWNTPPDISDRIVELLRKAPNFPGLGNGKPNAATSGVVAINHPQMCSGPFSCQAIECDGKATL